MMNDLPDKVNRQMEAYKLIFNIENIFRVAMHNCLVKTTEPNYFSEIYFKSFKYNLQGNSIKVDTIEIVNKAISTKNEESKYTINPI